MSLTQYFDELRARDEARDSLPGEHALVAAAGGALIVSALFAPSALRATLRAMLGGALLVRAASGRDGVARLRRSATDSGKAGNNPWPFPKSGQPSSQPTTTPAPSAAP